jgi:ABC-type nitrate/sulfonate/bicarbonate transport system ATPase subunit
VPSSPAPANSTPDEIRGGSGAPTRGPGADRGMVFQSYTLFPWLTVRENICFGLREKGLPVTQQAEIAERFIAEVGLGGFESHHRKQLSGGMQQRVALARALANDPKILLLDEPFTVLFVTHDIDEAIFMANRCIVFSARPGRIKRELAIELPYPRHYTLKTTPRFSELKAQLTEDIRTESLKTAQMERRGNQAMRRAAFFERSHQAH